METTDIVIQSFIALTGACAAFLSQCHAYNLRKWACIIALAGEPLWLYTTFQAQQWGIFAVCFLYAFAWMKGFYTYWIKHESQK